MTESLRNMLRGAKSEDEAYEILCAHGDGLSVNDQVKMYQMVMGNAELSEEDLDMVVGGANWFKKAVSKVGSWCANHKTELVIAACTIAGAAIGAVAVGAMVTAGIAGAATFGGAIATGASAGGVAGMIVGGMVAGIAFKGTVKAESED